MYKRGNRGLPYHYLPPKCYDAYGLPQERVPRMLLAFKRKALRRPLRIALAEARICSVQI